MRCALSECIPKWRDANFGVCLDADEPKCTHSDWADSFYLLADDDVALKTMFHDLTLVLRRKFNLFWKDEELFYMKAGGGGDISDHDYCVARYKMEDLSNVIESGKRSKSKQSRPNSRQLTHM